MIKPSDSLEFILSEERLFAAWRGVAAKNSAPGIDMVTVNVFNRNPNERIRALHEAICAGEYKPQPLMIFHKEKKGGGFRELTIPTIADRVVAKAVSAWETERCDGRFDPRSYAYRPRGGAVMAVEAVERTIARGKTTHVARIDIKDFFDTMDHSLLRGMLAAFDNPEPLIELNMLFAANPRFDGARMIVPESGVPQGSPVAPVLSNIYLDYFDRAMADCGAAFIRYADDIIIFAEDADSAGNQMNLAINALNSIHLRVSMDKSRIYRLADGFVYLGFLFGPRGKTPCDEAKERLADMLSRPRYDDETEEEYQKRLASMARGWRNYFEHGRVDHAGAVGAASEKTGVPTFSASSRGGASRMPVGEVRENSDDSFPKSRDVPDSNQDASPESSAEKKKELFEKIEELMAVGNLSEAVKRIRGILSSEEFELSESETKQCYGNLAELYEALGLNGAAEKCAKIAGRGPGGDHRKKDDDVSWATSDPAAWLDVFGGTGGVYRQYVDRVGRGGYKPASKPLNAEYLADHWTGRHTLAVPLFDAKDTVRFAVMDFDISRKWLDHLNADEVSELKTRLLDDARGVLGIALKAGVRGVLEDSGYKGYHVWFFFQSRQPATLAKHFLQTLDRVAGNPPEGTHRELFPASDHLTPDLLNSRIKLPLGLHKLSGSYSVFLNADGEIVKNPTHLLSERSIFNKRSALTNALAEWNRYFLSRNGKGAIAATEGSAKIAGLFAACPVLAALKAKAEREKRLNHYERVVLRGVLVPLGDEGRRGIHAVLRNCSNYSRHLTDKMICEDRANPMSCARIREILPHIAQNVGCDCEFRKKRNDYAHPLRHLALLKRDAEPRVEDDAATCAQPAIGLRGRKTPSQLAGDASDEQAGDVKTAATPARKMKRGKIFRFKITIGAFKCSCSIDDTALM